MGGLFSQFSTVGLAVTIAFIVLNVFMLAALIYLEIRDRRLRRLAGRLWRRGGRFGNRIFNPFGTGLPAPPGRGGRRRRDSWEIPAALGRLPDIPEVAEYLSLEGPAELGNMISGIRAVEARDGPLSREDFTARLMHVAYRYAATHQVPTMNILRRDYENGQDLYDSVLWHRRRLLELGSMSAEERQDMDAAQAQQIRNLQRLLGSTNREYNSAPDGERKATLEAQRTRTFQELHRLTQIRTVELMERESRRFVDLLGEVYTRNRDEIRASPDPGNHD